MIRVKSGFMDKERELFDEFISGGFQKDRASVALKIISVGSLFGGVAGTRSCRR